MHDAFWIFFELTSKYMDSLNNVNYNVNRSHGAQKQSEPNKLTCSQLCDFIAQLVRALHCTGAGS